MIYMRGYPMANGPKTWKIGELWLVVSFPPSFFKKKSLFCCHTISLLLTITLQLRHCWTWLSKWHRRQCLTCQKSSSQWEKTVIPSTIIFQNIVNPLLHPCEYSLATQLTSNIITYWRRVGGESAQAVILSKGLHMGW